MRRIMVLLAVMALLMVALAMPAFAAPSTTANCVGQLAADLNQSSSFAPGAGGQAVSDDARAGGTSGNATLCAYGHNR